MKYIAVSILLLCLSGCYSPDKGVLERQIQSVEKKIIELHVQIQNLNVDAQESMRTDWHDFAEDVEKQQQIEIEIKQLEAQLQHLKARRAQLLHK